MHTILVPTDGSGQAMKALHVACDLADKYGARIALLHILAKGKPAQGFLSLEIAGAFAPEVRDRLQEAASQSDPLDTSLLASVGESILAQAAARARRRGVEVEVLDMESGDPAETILVARKRVDANTIVMGCRGTGGGRGSSFGSVSNVVFERADCTCISVK